MGSSAAKPVRRTPVRYVAKKLPRPSRTSVEQQFKKPEFTAQGINTRRDDVNTEPLMYVETAHDGTGTEVTDHVAPRWYINTMMEMADNVRHERVIITGNLPFSWGRDRYEPYSLVRNRIDTEDLNWLLAPEQRKKSIDELLPATKLERNVLQDILDTVELPRVQYRNYKGKLHRTVDEANTHMQARQRQLEHAREQEVLRRIGYSEEEIANDAQYLTNRPRGVRTLDELGATPRERQRQTRAAQMSELEDMLEERRIEAIEKGDVSVTPEDLRRPERLAIQHKLLDHRKSTYKRLYAADINRDTQNRQKISWWLERRRRVRRAVDTIHGVPEYNERLSTTEDQMEAQMREAATFNMQAARAQGAKGFSDPRAHKDQLLDILRTHQKEAEEEDDDEEVSVEVHEDGVTESHDVFRFPHTRTHGAKPPRRVVRDRHDHVDPTEASLAPDDMFSKSQASTSNATPSASAATPHEADEDKNKKP